MADLSITATDVLQGTGARKVHATAGETITAGQPVYIDTADSDKMKRCDADASGTASCDGIALNGASDDQPITYQDGTVPSEIDLGATLVVGQTYVVSTNPGGIAPYSDLASGDFVTILGVAKTADLLVLDVLNSATAKA